MSHLASSCFRRVVQALDRSSSSSSSLSETNQINSGHAKMDKMKRKQNGSHDDRDGDSAAACPRRRVIIVVDSSKEECRGAVQWALTHTIQTQDTIILLQVVGRKSGGKEANRGRRHLNSLKNLCQAKKPQVGVEISLVEGRKQGPAIVEEARREGASLLVLTRRKRSIAWRLLMMWVGRRHRGGDGGGVVDYCLKNASCMTVAVRRKKKGRGYLITTKNHKDFWLLA